MNKQAHLQFSFSVTSRSTVSSWDLQLVTQRPIHRLRYSPKPPVDAVGIAFISTPPFLPSRSLHFSQDPLSPFIYLPPEGIQKESTSSTFLVHTRDFLMTDVFASTAEGSAVPLYWKHLLPQDASSDSTVVLYDHNFQPLKDIPYLHWHTTAENAVFNNLVSGYNPETGDFQVYYVSYLSADGTRRVELLNNVPAFSLLKVEEYDQFSPQGRYYTLDDRGNHYLVTSLFDYKTHSPTPRGLAYIIPPQSYGQILWPLTTDPTAPWVVRIGRLDFYWTGKDGNSRRYYINDFDYQDFSPYNPYRFVSQVSGTVLSPKLIKAPHGHLKIDPDENFHLECIVTKPDGTIRYALTTDPQKVLYTDQSGQLTGVHYRTDGFSSFDLKGGFIHLSLEIDVSDRVSLTYNYAEQAYDYPWLNLNPRFNPSILEQEAVIYLTPARKLTNLTNVYSQNGTEAANILRAMAEEAFGQENFLEAFPQLDKRFWYTADILILDAEDDSLSLDDIEAALTIGKLIIVNHSQYAAIKSALGITADDLVITDGEVSQKYLRYRLGILVDGSLESDSLVTSYQEAIGWFQEGWFEGAGLLGDNYAKTVKAQSVITIWRQLAAFVADAIARDLAPEQSLFHLTLDNHGVVVESNHPNLPLTGLTWNQFIDWFSTSTKNCNQFLVLGHLQVTTGGVQPYQIKAVDCRQRGGGYKTTSYWPSLVSTCPEVNWCLDQARLDGHPFPGAAAVLIELPYTVLIDYGGFLSRSEVQNRVKKYLGTGVYPVIRYYGNRDPRLLSCTATPTTITLMWENTGGPYTVYWGSSPDLLTNAKVVEGTTYTITGLNPGFVYTVLVTPIMDNSRMLSQEPLTISLPTV